MDAGPETLSCSDTVFSEKAGPFIQARHSLQGLGPRLQEYPAVSRQVAEGGQGKGPELTPQSPAIHPVPVAKRELPLGLLGSKPARDSQVQTNNWPSSGLWFLTCRRSVCVCGPDLH